MAKEMLVTKQPLVVWLHTIVTKKEKEMATLFGQFDIAGQGPQRSHLVRIILSSDLNVRKKIKKEKKEKFSFDFTILFDIGLAS
jgi:hypothetical protein